MEKKYIIGSHNSWSYIKPRKWWQRIIAFTARCQSSDITCQYTQYDVRCFDLRIRTKSDGSYCLAHGLVEYDAYLLNCDLQYLDAKAKDLAFREAGRVYVRVLHETKRHGRQASGSERNVFRDICRRMTELFPNLVFFGGYDVRTWHKVFDFCTSEPSQDGLFASNQLPHRLDDWWPWLYAFFHNPLHYAEGTNLDVMMLDYVEIGRRCGQ